MTTSSSTPFAGVPEASAARSGTFLLGGDLPVRRLGFGAMRLTGKGIWGEPRDRAEAIAVLRAPWSSGSTSSTPPTRTAPRSASG